MSKTYRFRKEFRKSHFKKTEFDYSDKQEVNCMIKTTYLSERLALNQAEMIMTTIDKKTGEMYAGKKISVYRCSACKNWHLTSQTPRKR